MKNHSERPASVDTMKPKLIKAAQALFIFNAGIWLLFGIISLAKISGDTSQRFTALVIAILMLGNVAALITASVGIGRQNRFFYFSVVILLINILLTITDEFGIFDFITLAIDLVLLGLLIINKSSYFPSPRS